MTERDWEQLPALLVDDVTYHNPAQFEPYRGKDALVGILRLVFSIFADFDYHRTFGREDGYTDGADNHDSGPTHLDSASGDTVSAYPNGEVAAAFTTRARPRPSAATVSRAAEPAIFRRGKTALGRKADVRLSDSQRSMETTISP